MGKIEFYPLKTNPNKCTSHKARSADNWSFIDDCLNTWHVYFLLSLDSFGVIGYYTKTLLDFHASNSLNSM